MSGMQTPDGMLVFYAWTSLSSEQYYKSFTIIIYDHNDSTIIEP